MAEEFIVRSPYPDPEIPEVDIYNFLMSSDGFNHPNRLSLVDADGKRAGLTYKQLSEGVDRAAAFLEDAFGFEKNSKLAFFCPNQPDFLILTLAVLKLGGTNVFMNHLLGAEEIRYELDLTSTKYVFCGQRQATIVEKLGASLGLQGIIVSGAYRDYIPVSRALNHERKAEVRPTNLDFDPKKQTAMIFFSSGTTGKPKGVENTHYNVLSGIITRSAQRIMVPTQSMIIFQPISHCYGMFLALAMLKAGSTSWLMPRFDLCRYLSLIVEHKVRVLQLVPPIAVQMMKSSSMLKKFDFSCVKDIRSGAATFPPGVEVELLKYFPNVIYIRQGYGLTETSTGVTITPLPDNLKVPVEKIKGQNQIGTVQPGMEMKIVDIHTGKSVGPNAVGELCFRGPSIMKGYYGNPKATSEAIDQKGWFHTGDIGYVDTDGIIFITGRKKELIKYNGLQVAPAELEDLLLRHDSIADAAVIGVPDLQAGELPMAFVVKRRNVALKETDVMKYIKERVASFKQLRGGVRFIDVIPKSNTGKILRRVLSSCIEKSHVFSKL